MRYLNILNMALLCSLAACSLPSRTASDKYVLKADISPMHGGIISNSIRINEPTAAAGLESDQISVLDNPNHLTHYNDVAWAKPVPILFQDMLQEGMQQSKRFKSISSDQDDISANTLVDIGISDFEVENDTQPPTIHINLTVKLVNADNLKAFSSFQVEKTIQATANHMQQLVEAFNIASNETVSDIIMGIAKHQ